MARNGRCYNWTGTLPVWAAGGADGQRILPPNDMRLSLILYNQGAGTAYINFEPDPGRAFPIPTGAALNFLTFGAPSNPVFAWGAAGHDLRAVEVIGPAVAQQE